MPRREIKGLKNTLTKLSNLGEQARTGLDQILEGVSTEIALNARQLAPKNFGQLARSINAQKTDDLTYQVIVNAEYGPYLEFGTGVKVDVPLEFREMASRFIGGDSGSFEDGLQAIKDWARAKGIPEEAAYPIFISILKNGIAPQPYLYPSFIAGRKQAIQDAENLILRLTK